MLSISPIPTSRVSDLLARNRLTNQLQQDQLDLFRLQDQISTGRRISLPSQDAPAALRAITLQRLLERKAQVGTNLSTNQSFLAATDASLNTVSGLLADIRGAALSVAGTISTDEQREAVAQQVSRAIQQLVDVGNQSFRGRFLFAGSRTGQIPFELNNGFVQFNGNERELLSYSDLDILFETNTPGGDVFGAISQPVQGSVDLNPHLTGDTLLSSLRGGQGIGANGAISISDGNQVSIVDISNASTLQDVADFIEANPPAGRNITVQITNNGLTLQLDSAGGGNLIVTEVAGGNTAKELGIYNSVGVLTAPLVGSDLNPRILGTTPVTQLLGTKAQLALQVPGSDNDLVITATQNGAAFNNTTVQFVDDNLLQATPGISAGNEYAQYDTNARAAQASLSLSGSANDLIITGTTTGTALNNVSIQLVDAGNIGNSATASYNAGAQTLTIGIDDSNETTVGEIISAIAATGQFTAAEDSSTGETLNPAATVFTSDAGSHTGNTGNSGGEAGTLYVFVDAGETTAEQAAAAITAEGTFTAETENSDAQTKLSEGLGAIDLSATGTTSGGSGEVLDLAGFRIENLGQTFDIDLAGITTVESLLNRLNGAGAGLHAEINAAGNGIAIRSRISGADFSIGELGGNSAAQLGVRTFNESVRLSELNRGIGVPAENGTDFTILSNDGTTQLAIDVSGAETVGDVIDLINNDPNNIGNAVLARLAQNGNGIELVDASPVGANTLTIQAENQSRAAEFLGLISQGETTNSASNTGGDPEILTGRDVRPQETESVFNTLIRLREALNSSNTEAIGEAITQIDTDISRVNFARSEVGARQQSLDILQTRLQDEEVELKTALSLDIDVDFTQAVSDLNARQISLQATLRTSANLLSLSILDFL